MAERTFTETLADLERAAERIGRQTTSLEEAMELFESGMKDAAALQEILAGAEQKVAIYDKKESSLEEL
ncbi:MAG: exodeoxyribonuclease VII small subunit [Mogibacterium sp.]|nr:exodeoxyribonuclease VII small subunit [Mogibacterium sp.]